MIQKIKLNCHTTTHDEHVLISATNEEKHDSRRQKFARLSSVLTTLLVAEATNVSLRPTLTTETTPNTEEEKVEERII